MPETLPADIEVEEGNDRVVYRLPRRSLGSFPWIVLSLGVGALVIGPAIPLIWRTREGFMVGSSLLPIGLTLVPFALELLLGRTVVELSRERLRTSSRVVGWGPWPSVAADPGLQILVNDNQGRLKPGLGFLATRLPGRAQRLQLARLHELRLLEPLAADLQRRLAQRSPMQ